MPGTSGLFAGIDENNLGFSNLKILGLDSPKKVGSLPIDIRCGVAASKSTTYIAGHGFQVIDTANPAKPFIAASYDLTTTTPDVMTYTNDMAAVGPLAYLANDGAGLVILRYTGEVNRNGALGPWMCYE